MRTWRKLHASILTSEHIEQLSDAAGLLLTFLIVAQDDSGYYPWGRPMVRRLIASRPTWTIEKARELADELVTNGIAEWQDGGIVLTKGQQYNGRPRDDRPEDVYARGIPVTVTGIPVTEHVVLRVEKSQSRVESEKSQSREDSSSSGGKDLTARIIKLATLHEQNIGPISGEATAANIKDTAQEFSHDEWYEPGMKIMVAQGKRSWAYFVGILRRWHSEGFDPTIARSRASPSANGKSATPNEKGAPNAGHRPHPEEKGPFDGIGVTYGSDP